MFVCDDNSQHVGFMIHMCVCGAAFLRAATSSFRRLRLRRAHQDRFNGPDLHTALYRAAPYFLASLSGEIFRIHTSWLPSSHFAIPNAAQYMYMQ